MEQTKIYKPEISKCPICGSKLKYKYTISNKVIQFYNGHYTRVKNLAYSCTNEECNGSKILFTSQTASKLCVKGYTYSSKVLAYIAINKYMHTPREKICDKLASLGVEISDRNIDIIYNKYLKDLNEDYKQNIKNEYDFMEKEFGQVRISIDAIRVEKVIFISVRNSFTNNQIGTHFIKNNEDAQIINLLKEYTDDERIACIATTRPFTNFFKLLKKAVNRPMSYIHFEKI